jgi:hypothetical protein
MTATNPEIKSALMSRGIWPDFVRLREDEKLAHGGTSRTQTIAALEKIAPDLVDLVRPRGRPRGNPPSPPSSQEGAPAENATAEPAPELPPSSLADAKRSKKDANRVAEELRWQLHGVDSEPKGVRARVSKEMFANKSCSISVAFMWAYSNLCFSDASPEDAPSAVAWQMYVDMMTSPSLKADMLKSGLGAAMRKAEAEGEVNGKFDGEGEYDLLAAIANGGGE